MRTGEAGHEQGVSRTRSASSAGHDPSDNVLLPSVTMPPTSSGIEDRGGGVAEVDSRESVIGCPAQ
jgi:hypothetical protein